MANPLAKLVSPRYPATAMGFEKGSAAMVQLEHGRGGNFNVRRAATVHLPDALLNPSFHEPNIPSPREMSAALRELAASAGLLQQKKWSVSLPDAASRT